MKFQYPEAKMLTSYLSDLLDNIDMNGCGDYLYLLGSVLADKVLPKLDPSLHYTVVSCAEDLDHFAQGFVERLQDAIQISQMAFWMSSLETPGNLKIPYIHHRFVEKDSNKSHEVIFIKPFILDPGKTRVSLLDILDRISPVKLHVAGLFVDEDVMSELSSDFRSSFHFEQHHFVEVSKILGERVYVWPKLEADMYKNFGLEKNNSVIGFMPETVKRKMLIKQ